MQTSPLLIALSLSVCLMAPRTAESISFEPDSPWPLCSEEVLYGTVIADPELGAFGLRGTAYLFMVSQEIELEDIDGKQVRIEIAPDCTVRDLHVIGFGVDALI